jgi:hypothetical protein
MNRSTLGEYLMGAVAAVSHAESFSDLFQRFFSKGKTKPTAEQSAADYGKGWGDEHDLFGLYQKLKPGTLEYWMGITQYGWEYHGPNIAKSARAKRERDNLRIFLTSWDHLSEKGGKTTTIEDKTKKDVIQKVEKIEKIFNTKTKNAVTWIEWVVELMRTEEARLLNGKTVNKMAIPNVINPVWEEARHGAYDFMLRQFKLCGIYNMPLRGQPDFLDNVDSAANWMKNLSTEDGRTSFIQKTKEIEAAPKGLLYRLISRIMFGKQNKVK